MCFPFTAVTEAEVGREEGTTHVTATGKDPGRGQGHSITIVTTTTVQRMAAGTNQEMTAITAGTAVTAGNDIAVVTDIAVEARSLPIPVR